MDAEVVREVLEAPVLPDVLQQRDFKHKEGEMEESAEEDGGGVESAVVGE